MGICQNPSVIAKLRDLFDVTVIAPDDQRYGTAADWFRNETGQHFRISDMRVAGGDARDTKLVAIHEMIEEPICDAAGITQEQVDAWDMAHADADDPGSLPGCPYGAAHAVAMAVERMVCSIIGREWEEHDKVVIAAGEMAQAACAARGKK